MVDWVLARAGAMGCGEEYLMKMANVKREEFEVEERDGNRGKRWLTHQEFDGVWVNS